MAPGRHDFRAWILSWPDSVLQGALIPPNHYLTDRRYTFYVTDNNVSIVPDTGNCDDLDGKNVRVHIEYTN